MMSLKPTTSKVKQKGVITLQARLHEHCTATREDVWRALTRIRHSWIQAIVEYTRSDGNYEHCIRYPKGFELLMVIPPGSTCTQNQFDFHLQEFRMEIAKCFE
ncbi:MAG: hypothetical protein ACREGJ_02340 [Candidatus Saccharimonadales bacterium]